MEEVKRVEEMREFNHEAESTVEACGCSREIVGELAMEALSTLELNWRVSELVETICKSEEDERTKIVTAFLTASFIATMKTRR